MHAHTKPVSPCGELTPDEIVETYRKKGYDAIVITNHFVYDFIKDTDKESAIKTHLNDYEQTVKAAEEKGLTVLLGTEIRFSENYNDYLIYGVNKEILSICYDYLSKGIKAFRTEVKLPDSVFVQAHPFRSGSNLADTKLLDGIEAFNMHPGQNSPVGLAVRAAYENKCPIITVGSDFHHKDKGHEAVSALRTKALPKTSFELAQILKSGDYIFEIGENSIVLP